MTSAAAFSTPHAAKSYEHYNARAPTYDAGAGGWHVDLGLDFVEWLRPLPPGGTALDLACGTGLVTLPLAAALGPAGQVVAVDLSTGMLTEARKKTIPPNSAPITWVEGDITALSSLPEVRQNVQKGGGFDIITVCSALVLLPGASTAIKHWASLLKKPGGRMIIDVPTEQKTLQYLFTIDLRRNISGLDVPFDLREWIKDVHSLERLYLDAGFEIERSWRTRSYLPEQCFEADQALQVFDQHVEAYKTFVEKGKIEEARSLWPDLWKENLTADGKFWDGHALYITIGKRV